MANKNATTKAEETRTEEEISREQREELAKKLREEREAEAERQRNALEVMKDGKGRLELETPIRAKGTDINVLVYDFTKLTGQDYIEAMDADSNSSNIFRITYRQALCLFATAAAKQTAEVDARDILERIGMTDAVEGAQLAMLFFNASTRAGRMRISKM